MESQKNQFHMKPNNRINLSRRIHYHFHVNGCDGGTTLIKLLLVVPIILRSVPTVLAQSDSEDQNTNESATEFDPKMAILMIVLVSAFFLLGFFSIYLRRCAERLFGLDSGQPVDPGAWRNARGGARGLDLSVIESFPTFLYSAVKGLRIGKEALECAVCLNEFEEHETLRLIPKCSHVFHPDCIDAWLQFHTTCPLCRANLVPKPGETVSFQLPVPVNEPVPQPGPDQRKRVLDSPDVRLMESVTWTNKNRPPRSRSTGWKLTGLFPNYTCDSLVQIRPGGNLERFTLRLPEEAHNQLVNSNHNRSKSHVALSQERSSKSGYRSGSVGEERNYFYNDKFDNEGRFDRRPFSITPPHRTGALQSPNITGDQERASPPKSLLQTLKSPLDRMFLGKDHVGERSSDCLRQDSQV